MVAISLSSIDIAKRRHHEPVLPPKWPYGHLPPVGYITASASAEPARRMKSMAASRYLVAWSWYLFAPLSNASPAHKANMGSTTSLLSSDSALTYLLVLFLPSIPSLLAKFRRWRAPPPVHPAHASPPTSPRPARLYLILGIHTLYRIKQLVRPPFNVFTQFRIPLSANRELLQAAFVRYYAFLAGAGAGTGAGGAYKARDLPESIQKLIGRLSNVDYRLLYARYGHEVLEGCAWCSTHDDFAVAALPGIVAPYAGMAVLLGVLGWNRVGGRGMSERAGRLRGAIGWALAGMAGAEVAVRYLWDLRIIQGDVVQVCIIFPLETFLASIDAAHQWST